MIFNKHYSNSQHTIPYFWMPKYTNASDSSARTLEFYKNINKISVDTINNKKIL